MAEIGLDDDIEKGIEMTDFHPSETTRSYVDECSDATTGKNEARDTRINFLKAESSGSIKRESGVNEIQSLGCFLSNVNSSDENTNTTAKNELIPSRNLPNISKRGHVNDVEGGIDVIEVQTLANTPDTSKDDSEEEKIHQSVV